ncbi:thiol reductase thioredoxin [Winogradskyella sp. PC-19]|uniref:thioredoxin family protein n=1 Tax=unclassified Winogradskyella TaxID=2615021 RepID=UPI000B3C3FCA|nr:MULTISPECIES: thioredoxin domain-containing protein [unclassified Winogradskyella]ARV08854.1 thiol reductase thioredoxin [Winogradskyella sp. PC-19]RZN79913.1 MAG: thiol reductase thioredoxin [Winogradskyella sp.]
MKNIFFFVLLSCFYLGANAQTEITDANAESKLLNNNNRLILVDFYATWCGPCKRMAPIIKELESEYPNVDFYKIDVDKNQVDDALGVSAMPTYVFIKNSSNLEQIEGAMSKAKMKSLLDKHLSSGSTIITAYDATAKHGNSDEYSQATLDVIWNSSSRLNSLAWHTYEEHGDVDSLLKAIKIVERSIDLEATYYNVDTHAALLYKTGNYTKALKKAKEAIEIAKQEGLSYTTTSELIDSIIDKL